VTLDTETRISVQYQDQERRIELQAGRARFFPHNAPGRLFVVEANGAEVLASGTLFDVELADAGATVSLLEGAAEVIVRRPDGDERVSLQPGQRVAIARGDLEEASPLVQAETKWTAGMLEFRGKPLREVIAEANRYSRTKIRLADREVGELRVSGTFRAGDTAGLARSLAVAFDIRVEHPSRGQIVLRTPH
jgi:transmembrane sensor